MEIPVDSSMEFAQAFIDENWIGLVALILLNVVNPAYHIFKNKPEDFWSFLKSTNFWSNVAALAITVMVFFGIGIPQGTGQIIIDAIVDGDINGLVLIVFTNVVNPLYHFFMKKKAKDSE